MRFCKSLEIQGSLQFVRVVLVLVVAVLSGSTSYGHPAGVDVLGSAQPGLKAIYVNPQQFAVFLDQPETVGVGLTGGYKQRKILVIADINYGVVEKFATGVPDVPEQLFSVDKNAAFSCSGGNWNKAFSKWNYFPRPTRMYSLIDGRVIVTSDAYASARRRYELESNQLFLGKIDSKIFFWDARKPTQIYFRGIASNDPVGSVDLPRNVIDVMGVTKSVSKELSIVVFEKSSGIFHAKPYTFDVLNIRLPSSDMGVR